MISCNEISCNNEMLTSTLHNLDNRSSSRQIPQVIVDVDAGGDDAMALVLLVAAHRCQKIEILGITCVHGNASVKNVYKNVWRILEATNCLNIPVFQGAEKPLIPHTCDSNLFFGTDGFGDINFPEALSIRDEQQENAIEALNRLTCNPNRKGNVSLICLGPLTNLALALRTYSRLAENVQAIYIMGGNHTGVGNATSAAEFNFFNDPEAAHIVLTSVSCPVTLFPWETSLRTEIPMDWRFNILGQVNNKAIEILNAVEKKAYSSSQFSVWYPCDAVVAAIFLRPEIIVKNRKCHVSVELHGHRTRGQVVVDHLQNNRDNVNLVEEVDCSLLQKLLLWAVGHPDMSSIDDV